MRFWTAERFARKGQHKADCLDSPLGFKGVVAVDGLVDWDWVGGVGTRLGSMRSPFPVLTAFIVRPGADLHRFTMGRNDTGPRPHRPLPAREITAQPP